MARVVFELPSEFVFSTVGPIYIGHINHGHHLDNAQLLGLVAEARTRFLRSMGYTDRDAEGLAMVVGDVVVQYESEALYGETLRIDMTPMDFNKYGFDLVFRITGPRRGPGQAGAGVYRPARAPRAPAATGAAGAAGAHARLSAPRWRRGGRFILGAV